MVVVWDHSSRWLAHLEAIPGRIGDDGKTHATANGFNWTRHDVALSEAGHQRVEVVHQESRAHR